MIKRTFLVIAIASFTNAYADNWSYQTRGYLFGRLQSYTKETSRNYGQQMRAQFEQSTSMSSHLSALNQLRWSANSLYADLSPSGVSTKKDNFETYLGENYLKIKTDNWVAQLGYQEVVWGEAFGFNYADVISPKDERETLFSDAGDARRPLLLANTKFFFSSGELSGSLQLLYSPEPRFSKTLPIQIYAGSLLEGINVNVNKQSTPKFFDESEFGGKLSVSYGGLDVALFQYSYLDRSPYYILNSATLTDITVTEDHSKIKSMGASLAKTIYDFVFRTDFVLTKNKRINSLENGMLSSYQTDSTNMLFSLDSPAYHDYTAVLILARSTLNDEVLNSFREKNQQYAIVKLSKNLGEDRALEFSYTHEFEHAGRSIQSLVSWPINSTTDLKLGGQFYSGDEQSNLQKFKNVSSIFFSLKNYFQL